MLPNGLKGFKQRDLVAEAFAGDDVVQVCLFLISRSQTNDQIWKRLTIRTLPLKRLDRLRLMLLQPRIQLFQDGYVFLIPSSSLPLPLLTLLRRSRVTHSHPSSLATEYITLHTDTASSLHMLNGNN